MQKIYKFAVLILLLAGGSLFLFNQFVSNYNIQINKTQNEINGVVFAQKLQSFVLYVQKLRGYNQFSQGSLNEAEYKFVQDEVRITTINIKKDIEEIKEFEKLYPKLYDNDYKHIIKELEELMSSSQISNNVLFQKYTYIIEQLKEKMYHLGFKSELLLESDSDKYFLVDIMLKHIPNLIETTAKIRGEASKAMLDNTATDEMRYSLRNSCMLCKEHIRGIFKVLNGLAEDVEKTRLVTLLDSIVNESEKMQEYVKQTVVSEETNLNALNFFTLSSAVINKMFLFYTTDSEFLNKKLMQKLDKLKKTKLYGIIVGAAVLIFIIVTVISMVRSSLLYVRSEKKIKNNLTSIINLKNELEKCKTIQDISSAALYFFTTKFSVVQGAIYLFNEENNKLYLASSYATNEMKPIIELGEGLIGEVAVQKKHISTYTDDNNKKSINIESIVISPSSICTIPMISYDKLFGVMQIGAIKKGEIKYNDDFQYFTDMIVGFLRDAQHLETSKKYIELIDKHVITSKTNTDGVITEVSDAFTKISGYSKKEIIGKTHAIVAHPDTSKKLYKNMWDTILSGHTWNGEVKNLNKNGKVYWAEITITPSTDRYNNILGFSAILRDITDKKRIEEYSITDALTGLYNRRFFDTTFSTELKISKRENKNLVFLIIDIDYFKQYNDSYGHHKGDEVLKAISSEMKLFFKRANDYVYRLGGEEFAVSFYANNAKHAIERTETLRKKIEELKIEHNASGVSKYISISIGHSFIPKECIMDVKEIYEITDGALYLAKKNGRNRVEVVNFDL